MARTKQTNADAEERRRTERELAEAAEVCREYERRHELVEQSLEFMGSPTPPGWERAPIYLKEAWLVLLRVQQTRSWGEGDANAGDVIDQGMFDLEKLAKAQGLDAEEGALELNGGVLLRGLQCLPALPSTGAGASSSSGVLPSHGGKTPRVSNTEFTSPHGNRL